MFVVVICKEIVFFFMLDCVFGLMIIGGLLLEVVIVEIWIFLIVGFFMLWISFILIVLFEVVVKVWMKVFFGLVIVYGFILLNIGGIILLIEILKMCCLVFVMFWNSLVNKIVIFIFVFCGIGNCYNIFGVLGLF